MKDHKSCSQRKQLYSLHHQVKRWVEERKEGKKGGREGRKDDRVIKRKKKNLIYHTK